MPTACTCASPGRRESLRGGVQKQWEGEARRNLRPGRPGRPQRSCSRQQVRRTRTRSLSLSLHLLRWSGFAGETPAIGPVLRSSLRAAASGPPSFSRQRSAATGSSGARRRASRAPLFSTASGTAPAPLGSGPRVSTAQADSGRRAGGRAPLLRGSGSAPRPPRIVPLPGRLRSPLQHRSGRQLANSPLPGEPRTKPRSWGLAQSLGVGVCNRRGLRPPPQQCRGRAGEGA